MVRLRGWWVTVVIEAAVSAQAGTVGMTGQWDFAGTATFYDGGGGMASALPATGVFDFDARTVAFRGISGTFFGFDWSVPGGGLADNGDGTYAGSLALMWGTSSSPVSVPWEITDLGNGTATVVTLDGNRDGIPGLVMANGLFPGSSLAIDGSLTQVPEPMSAALMGSAAVWLGLRQSWKRWVAAS